MTITDEIPIQDTIEVVFETDQPVNHPLLQQELNAAVGEDVLAGVCIEPGKVRVIVDAAISEEIRDRIGPVIAAHDANGLTAAQQAAAERQQLVETLDKPWDAWIEADKDTLLRILAGQIGLGV
ncbi:MAG: hypothetical protein JXJ20_02015 [Anaerolineae bacterium]|nr:hypothetical protein [Anaerolineae bacterium]